MAIQKILLPYNFTAMDQKAVNFVIDTFALLQDIEVTIFNAYTAVPEIETPATSVTTKLKSGLSYLAQKIAEQENELNRVKQKLIQGGFSESRLRSIFRPRKKDIAGEIMDLASKDQYDVIVLNRRHMKVSRFFSGSVSHKVVMSLKAVTVCIVS
jgi:nucleotide-binding universal stress UspA family protein